MTLREALIDKLADTMDRDNAQSLVDELLHEELVQFEIEREQARLAFRVANHELETAKRDIAQLEQRLAALRLPTETAEPSMVEDRWRFVLTEFARESGENVRVTNKEIEALLGEKLWPAVTKWKTVAAILESLGFRRITIRNHESKFVNGWCRK